MLELYSPVIGQSSDITKLINTLHQKVKDEISLQKEVAKVIGSVEMIFAGDTLRNKTKLSNKNRHKDIIKKQTK